MVNIPRKSKTFPPLTDILIWNLPVTFNIGTVQDARMALMYVPFVVFPLGNSHTISSACVKQGPEINKFSPPSMCAVRGEVTREPATKQYKKVLRTCYCRRLGSKKSSVHMLL